MEEKDFQTRTNEYAVSCIESMRDDLDALAHARECNGTLPDGKPCKRGSETKLVTVKGKKYKHNVHEHPEAWHDEYAAESVIQEGHYGIQVRSDWHTPDDRNTENSEFEIILGGGGPASRIIGTLDRGQPDFASFEFQDWGMPWTKAHLNGEQEDTLLEWSQQHYFGE